MSVTGIDYEKCTGCRQCIVECIAIRLDMDEEQEKVVFVNPICSSCGHCIAVCPENAVLFKSMRDEPSTFEGVQDPSTLISYETMYRFMRAKRSIRQYKKKKIPKEIMEKVIDTMRYAPTGSNLRTMRCLIISDEEKIKTLSEAVQKELTKTFPEIYIKGLEVRRKRGRDPIFWNAPHIIILYSKTTTDYPNAIVALTYGMFAAQTLGLGTCWNGLSYSAMTENEEIRKDIAGVPGKVMGVMTIGYPSVKYFRAPPRPPLRIKGINELK